MQAELNSLLKREIFGPIVKTLISLKPDESAFQLIKQGNKELCVTYRQM